MKTTEDLQRQRDARNKRRRDKYAKDRNYRKAVTAQNRTNYRARAGVKPREACSDSIPIIHTFGKLREVVIGRKTEERMTFTVMELARALRYHEEVVYRWQSREQFPQPKVLLSGREKGAPGSYVFTQPQAVRLLTVMAEHQKSKFHFQQTDVETIRQLFAAMKGEV